MLMSTTIMCYIEELFKISIKIYQKETLFGVELYFLKLKQLFESDGVWKTIRDSA